MLQLKFILQLKKKGSHFAFLLLLSISCKVLVAQNQNQSFLKNPIIDSLQLVLKNTRNDSQRVSIYNSIILNKLYILRNVNRNFDSLYSTLMNDASRSLKLAQKINYKKEIAWAYALIGMINDEKGELAEALNYYFKVLNISEEIGDTDCAMSQYYSIGRIYFGMDNVSEALKYFLVALKSGKETGKKIRIASCDSYLGKIYFQFRNYQKAEEYFSESLKLATIINDSSRIAEGYFGIGNVYREEGNFRKALQIYFTVLKNFKNSPKTYFIFKSYIGIGNIYCKQATSLNPSYAKDEYLLAVQYLTKGLKYLYLPIITEISSKEILEAYASLTLAYTGLKDYKNALYYSSLYSKLIASVYSKKSYAKISELIMRNEQQKELALEKINQEKTNSEQQRKNRLIIIICIVGMIIFVFSVLLLRQRKLKKRAIEKAANSHKMIELEMQSLRSQLNPHFMFNSLNSIQELILMEENDKSHSYLSRFGKLLRMLLENAEKPFIPIRKEIDFLELYLALENLRIPDLQYSISTDPKLNLQAALIPNMILQPYIENAIWHGLSHKEEDKQLQIRIYRQNGTVNYEIEDNGVGRKKSTELKSLFRQKHESKGMELLSKRFKLLNEEYSSDINTTITDIIKNDVVTGTLVIIRVPVKLSEHQLN